MAVVYITLLILAASVVMIAIGKLWLTYYGFKYSAGVGLGVLLFEPMTLWFAFYKLEKEGKERYVTMWMLGLILIAVIFVGFSGPVMDGLTGRAFADDYLQEKVSAPPPKKDPPKTDPPKAETTPPATPTPNGATPDAGGAAPAAGADAGATGDAGAAPAAPAPGGAAPAPGGAAPAPGGAAPAAPAGGAAPAPAK